MTTVRVEDISNSLGKPVLTISDEGGIKTIQGRPYVDKIPLAHWQLQGTINLNLNASAYVVQYDHQEQSYTLAEIVIADLEKRRWASWRTYRVWLPNGVTVDQVTSDLKKLLSEKLCHT